MPNDKCPTCGSDVEKIRAEAFEEAADTVDRMRTQHEVMAGFGTTTMAALRGMAKAARAAGEEK